jgi:hypothetical protein
MKDMHKEGTLADPDAPTDDERIEAMKAVCEEFLGVLMLSGANRDKYSALKNELANQYDFGNDLYPKSMDQCLTMLNHCMVNPTRPQPRPLHPPGTPPKAQDEALVFAQGSDKEPVAKSSDDAPLSKSPSSKSSSCHTITKVMCHNCGKLGHMSSVCPDNPPPPAQIHALATKHDNASEPSKDKSVIFLTQFNDSLFTQDASDDCRPINLYLLLLNSQSAVHLFSHPGHVNNIQTATTPIHVHCNKGTLATTKEADFGDTPVYFDARSIANVLSLYHFGKKCHITYDSQDCGGVFKVLTPHRVVKFKPTEKGLHALNLREIPEAAYLLVNDTDPAFAAPIQTVRKNFKGFTKKQIKQATAARRLMGMIRSLSECNFQGLVHLNLLKDYPITNADIIHAHKIFGPDLANIRGKTVHHKPEQVTTDYIDIPRAILDVHSRVTLVANVMFINGVPFLISASRNINLRTIEHVPHCTAAKLGHLLQHIINVYTRAGFMVQTILMDDEFEKVKDQVSLAVLNTSVAAEHIGKIERRIRVVKERCRGIICTLPYTRLPQQMLIHLLHFIVMWLNNFPVSRLVSNRFSPRELIL